MSDKAVLNSAMITLGSTTAFSIVPEEYGGKGELPSPKLLIGTALSFLGLSILNDFAPQLANMLGISLAVTAFLYFGLPVATTYFGKANP